MVKKTNDWKKNVEANSRLLKKFEESRSELENVLQVAYCCLKERGDPEELLRKHTVSMTETFECVSIELSSVCA